MLQWANVTIQENSVGIDAYGGIAEASFPASASGIDTCQVGYNLIISYNNSIIQKFTTG